jgi:hypothetical protein
MVIDINNGLKENYLRMVLAMTVRWHVPRWIEVSGKSRENVF